MKKFGKVGILSLMCLILLCQSVSAATLLVPGGQVIGLEVQNSTVSVAAFDEALGDSAKAAGLRVGDRLTKVDSTPVQSVEDVRSALDSADGAVRVEVLRDTKTHSLTLTPKITRDGPRLGVFLKQGITGIGTVTWYDPDSGTFGALGHGVNDSAGELAKMEKGNVYNAAVRSVKKGQVGEPGQLVGALDGNAPIGTLSKNTRQGVFGTVSAPWIGEPLPVAETDEISTGDATILSTIKDQQVQEYSVEILKIYPSSRGGGRNLLLRVTDPALLAATGGIVQGMSGSPILQNGRIVGAVTHVLVNDPTTGYGIFIENMLDAAA